jgi:hypothetical protein
MKLHGVSAEKFAATMHDIVIDERDMIPELFENAKTVDQIHRVFDDELTDLAATMLKIPWAAGIDPGEAEFEDAADKILAEMLDLELV